MRKGKRRLLVNGAAGIVAALLVTGCSESVATSFRTNAPGTPGTDTAPFGSWTATLTEADLRAAGITDAPVITENIGTFTFTVAADGTWTVAQRADHPVRWPVFRGRWTLPAVGLLAIETEFPEDYAGEQALLRWSIDDAGLHVLALTPPDPLLKAQWESHPWARSP